MTINEVIQLLQRAFDSRNWELIREAIQILYELYEYGESESDFSD